MPTTRKQKKARKSRGLEMLSDIENIDIMLGENHFNAREREKVVWTVTCLENLEALQAMNLRMKMEM